MTVIDIHPHIIANDPKKYHLSPLGGHQSDWSRTRPVTTEQMIAAMDQAGVAKSALVQASTCYGHDNSYVADAVAAHPDRFTGVFSVDVLAVDALQMSPAAFPQMMRMVQRFPSVRIILDHLARPNLQDGPPYAAAESLFALAKYPTIYIKLTPRSCIESRTGKATPETFFPKLVSTFGASRIAWGSNYPSSEGSLPELLALAKNALSRLSPDDQSWIFAKTAQSLYPALTK